MAEPFYIIDNAKFEMVNSKYAMTTICNILMNLVVLENKVVEDAHIFYHLLKFIMNTLPSLENNGEVGRYRVSAAPHSFSLLYIELCCTVQVLVLYGNLGVLGLLILQKHTRRPKSTDYSIFRFIQVSLDIKYRPESTQHVLLRPWCGSCGTLTTARRPGRRRSWWSPLPTSSTGTI